MRNEKIADNRNTGDNAPRGIASVLFDYVEIFAWSLFAVILIFTFALRICRVDGESMTYTLQDGEKLMVTNLFYTPKQDDIIVFHLTNPEAGMEKTLVKRVIAVSGQTVELNTKTGELTIDGVPYEDAHRYLLRKTTSRDENGKYVSAYEVTDSYSTSGLFFYGYDESTGIFRTTVPEGHVFVMGDNRNNSRDSRNPSVGFVDERCILGKVILRLYPLTWLG